MNNSRSNIQSQKGVGWDWININWQQVNRAN
jgi:hypothetical protein